jgi:hypothetical protein
MVVISSGDIQAKQFQAEVETFQPRFEPRIETTSAHSLML